MRLRKLLRPFLVVWRLAFRSLILLIFLRTIVKFGRMPKMEIDGRYANETKAIIIAYTILYDYYFGISFGNLFADIKKLRKIL